MTDFTKLTLVKHKNALPAPEKTKEVKPKRDEPYKTLIKVKKIDTVKEKVRITVKDLVSGYVYCVTTTPLDKYANLLSKFEKKYKKIGRVKIEDINDN